MKRSEMVEIINKKLMSSLKCYVGFNMKNCREVADILLDEIEFSNMLPPGKLIVPGSSDHFPTQDNLDFYKTCVWEEEDEA